ncbi:transglycosylase domain-containing protein [Dictyobacter arantiisoli]|uniref:Uncharacterized protein n=1 Tax=Dictyobacter arantiisoli TaxID=2014874 RepID=A0A5A5T5F8_9CHLR|nr:transglycosylase domain-containing protein [Dictyobacter arantiisoli]GCF06582.1 hypothetical protein KDI_01460 [Dictyobacter arantiisoli]
MSSHGDQQSESDQLRIDDSSVPVAGGLLRNYKSQQESPILLSPPLSGLPVSRPGSISPLSLPSLQRDPLSEPEACAGNGLLFQRSQGLLAYTVDIVRRWSGKIVAVTGHTVQPPAPYMQLHHPSTEVKQASLVQRKKPWRRSRSLRVSMQMKQRRVRWQQNPCPYYTYILLALLGMIILSSFAGTAYSYGYYMEQLPRMNELANEHIAQNTRIYDRNNVLLYEVYDQNSRLGGRRIMVRYEDIPRDLQDALIAIEDKTFWMNAGVEPMAILRAAARQYGGGSTLTQQVIKNLSNNHEYALSRKLTEAAMAIGLTQQYSKTKILEMYFNIAPFGAQTYGVEVAVEDYFGLAPICHTNQRCIPGVARLDYNQQTGRHDPLLELARASFLAGMPNQPGYNDPTTGEAAKQRALARQELVLQEMIDQHIAVAGLGLITPALAQKAHSLMAHTTFRSYMRYKYAPHFVDWVINQVSNALGNGDLATGYGAFFRAGLNIRTSIDAHLEDYVERAVARHINQPEYQKVSGYYSTLSTDKNLHTAAVVVMDAKTGEILAMDGSADYNSTDPRVGGQYNAAINARPPGSSFKPLEYATSFEKGWYPGIVLQDDRTYFPNHAPAGTPMPVNDDAITKPHTLIYAPYDYGHTYTHRLVTLRTGTANSYNIPAIRTMQFVGANDVLNTAHRLGITSQANTGLAWALGSKDVSPLQMVNAYQTFANQGQRIPPQSVLDIWDNYGHNLYHYNEASPPAGPVFSPQVSYMMTSVLADEPSRAPEFGSDHDLSFADMDANCAYSRNACTRQVAAKTGTTDDFRDNWTIGYTPDVVVGVWVGNANNDKMNDVIGITGAGPIWHSVMERVLGRCNDNPPLTNPFVTPDQIACGPDYHFRFSEHPQWTFTIPDGLTQVSTSPFTGLPASSGLADWVLVNQAASQN